jgi:hypothetical protein
MEAIMHNPKFAQKVGVPQRVGQEYVQADKAKQYGQALKAYQKSY